MVHETPEADDKRLIKLCCLGEKEAKEAFPELMKKHHNLMHAVAYGVIGDSHAVQDVVSVSMAKVYNLLPTLKDPEKFKSWLRPIVKNTALDWRRTNKKKFVVSLDSLQDNEGDTLSLEAPDTRPPEEITNNDDLQKMVREEIDRLPESYRQIVALKYMEQRSYEEISALTGLSHATIESRLFRARGKLKTKFERFFKPENNGS